MVKLVQRLPTKKLERVHSCRKVAEKVAKDMVKLQTEQYLKGDEGGKDILSILSAYLTFLSLARKMVNFV